MMKVNRDHAVAPLSKPSLAVMTLVFPIFVLLASCRRDATPSARPTQTAAAPSALSQVDLGASALAGVGDARWSIAQGDSVAAQNALHQSIRFAVDLPDHPSKLLAAIAVDARRSTGTAPGPAAISPFFLKTKLENAAAELDSGNTETADADLRAVQVLFPNQLLPLNFALLQVAQSLDLAASAANDGVKNDLNVHLRNARRALLAYQQLGFDCSVSKTLADVDQYLKQEQMLAKLSPDHIHLWLGDSLACTHSVQWLEHPHDRYRV